MTFHQRPKMSELELWENLFGEYAGIEDSIDIPTDGRAALRLALRTLTPREEKVIRLHYGIDVVPRPLNEIAKTLWSSFNRRRGVTNTRAHQIHEKALRKLRHRSRLAMLIPTAQAIGIPLTDYHRGFVLTLPPVDPINYDSRSLQSAAATRMEAKP